MYVNQPMMKAANLASFARRLLVPAVIRLRMPGEQQVMRSIMAVFQLHVRQDPSEIFIAGNMRQLDAGAFRSHRLQSHLGLFCGDACSGAFGMNFRRINAAQADIGFHDLLWPGPRRDHQRIAIDYPNDLCGDRTVNLRISRSQYGYRVAKRIETAMKKYR